MGGQLKTGEQIRAELKASIATLLIQRGGSTELTLPEAKPAVLLIVGVNGGGKTTTIGKLAHRFAGGGASVVLAAGDTFRAAAAEQLEEWARRSGAEIVRAEVRCMCCAVCVCVCRGQVEGRPLQACMVSPAARVCTAAHSQSTLLHAKTISERQGAARHIVVPGGRRWCQERR